MKTTFLALAALAAAIPAAHGQSQRIIGGDFNAGYADSTIPATIGYGAPTAASCGGLLHRGRFYTRLDPVSTASSVYVCLESSNGSGTFGWVIQSGSGSMTYPGAGVGNSTGSAWGTSYTVGTGNNNLVQLNGSAQLPAVSGALLTNLPAPMTYPGAGVGNSTGSAWGTSYTVGTGNNNLVQLNGSAQLPAVSGALLTNLPASNHVCDMVIGDTSGNALTDAQLGPQKRLCFIPSAATIVEVDVSADGGTPNVVIAKNTAGTISNILSGALATASSGGIACANTGGTTGIDGATTCTNTLQNTSVAAGAYLQLVSGTAGGTAKLFTAHVIYTY